MPRVCCVNGCLTGSAHNSNQEKRLIFEISQNETVRQKWLKVLFPFLRGKKNRKTYYVCELQFQENDIQRFFVDNLHNEVHKIPRHRVTLRLGSIPSIFEEKCEKTVPSDVEVAIKTPQLESSSANCDEFPNSLNPILPKKDVQKPTTFSNMIGNNNVSSSLLKPVEEVAIALDNISTSYNLFKLKNDLVQLMVSSSLPINWTFIEGKSGIVVV